MKKYFIFLATFIFSASTAMAQANVEVEDTGPRYKLVLIAIILTVLYLISLVCVKAKLITVFNNRRIWNVLLLIVFLVTAVMGIMLIFSINSGRVGQLYPFLLYWHVEFGSAMVVITLFHLSWHLQYYAAIFKRKLKVVESNDK